MTSALLPGLVMNKCLAVNNTYNMNAINTDRLSGQSLSNEYKKYVISSLQPVAT